MEAIGRLASQALGNLTDSPPRSDTSLVAKPEIRLPRNIEEANALWTWANAQRNDLLAATPRQLAKHLSFIEATLPSKNVDGESGQMRTVVYTSLLADYSDEALAFMARRVCQTLDWFPTPRQCIEILGQYRAPPNEKETALSLCHAFEAGRYDAFLQSIDDHTATQDEIMAVPDQWRRIAVERGLLRRMPDGSHVIREDDTNLRKVRRELNIRHA